MKINSKKLPILIIAIGILVAVCGHLLTSMCKAPTVTEQSFDFSVTYKLDGETKTLEGVYTSRFQRFGNGGIDPLDRYYDGEYTINGTTSPSRTYTIDQKEGMELYIVMSLNDYYLMGDKKNLSYSSTLEAPCLEAIDEEGIQYADTELPDVFDAEIVSWECSAPIENNFVFVGFAGFHTVSTVVMIIVGLLTLVACMIFVKKESDINYGVLDILGIILNFAATFIALPFMFLMGWLIQMFPTGADWIYQAYLCLPAILPFTLAASVSLRRKGFAKLGFFIQFIAPVLTVVVAIFEYIT